MIGGYSEEQLRNTEQPKADKEVARLLNISVTHSVLLRKINDGEPGAPSDVLTNPEKYLGENYQAVMKFWWYMDSLTETQWTEVARRYRALDPATVDAAKYAARSAVWDAAWSAAGDAARYAAWDAAGDAAGSAAEYAAGYATYELMGGIENPVFLPMFKGFVAG
jgi:hypothetical protein